MPGKKIKIVDKYVLMKQKTKEDTSTHLDTDAQLEKTKNKKQKLQTEISKK